MRILYRFGSTHFLIIRMSGAKTMPFEKAISPFLLKPESDLQRDNKTNQEVIFRMITCQCHIFKIFLIT